SCNGAVFSDACNNSSNNGSDDGGCNCNDTSSDSEKDSNGCSCGDSSSSSDGSKEGCGCGDSSSWSGGGGWCRRRSAWCDWCGRRWVGEPGGRGESLRQRVLGGRRSEAAAEAVEGVDAGGGAGAALAAADPGEGPPLRSEGEFYRGRDRETLTKMSLLGSV